MPPRHKCGAQQQHNGRAKRTRILARLEAVFLSPSISITYGHRRVEQLYICIPSLDEGVRSFHSNHEFHSTTEASRHRPDIYSNWRSKPICSGAAVVARADPPAI